MPKCILFANTHNSKRLYENAEVDFRSNFTEL